MQNSVVLSVGDEFHLKMGRDRVVYAGMPSDDVYSIIQRKKDDNRGFSWNLFFPRNQQDITIDGIRISVDIVTPEEIRFRIIE